MNSVAVLDVLNYNLKEFASLSEGNVFTEQLLKGVLKEQKNLDNIIQQAAPQWPLNRISAVDRNILRIGIYELLFSNKDEVPPKVAINEAIELAKAFGGENSGRFVSGVLGTIYRELGEPGKYETSKLNGQKNKIDENQTKLPVRELGGAIIFAQKGDHIFLVLVHNVFGYWTLVKGSKEENETLEECVAREAKEETGLTVVVGEKIGVNEYNTVLSDDETKTEKRTLVKKRVTYFLARAKFENLKLEENGGEHGTLDDIKWFSLSETEDIGIYDDLKSIIKKAIEVIKKKII